MNPKPHELVFEAVGDRKVRMSRVFAAPRERVFEAMTQPELLKRWFGPPGWALAVCELDLWVGGEYRYVWRGEGGAEIGVRGAFREVVAPARIVLIERFDEPWFRGEALLTKTLEDADGGTRFTHQARYESSVARQTVVGSGAEARAAASYERLAELLAGVG